MVNAVHRILDRHGVMILDGALATELERRGCDLRDPLWSARVLIDHPKMIKQIHADYFAAGADCATTATYQATLEGFARRGLTVTDAEEKLRLAVSMAIEARDEFWANPSVRDGRPRPIVAASIGSYGAFLADGSEYSGVYGLSEDDLVDFHRPRMTVLAESGADLIAYETIPSLAEARALVRLLHEFSGASAWISFSARDGTHTSHGESLSDCAAWLNAHDQIAAVGVNCIAPRHVADLVSAIRSATDKPILVYPNSGETYLVAEKRWIGEREVEPTAAQISDWYERGAQIFGGCCRTTPETIRWLAAWVRAALETDTHGDC